MKMDGLLLLFVSILFLGAACGTNPGFKARITQYGINYANKVALEALKSNVGKLKIPDQSGDTSGVKYEIKNIRVTDFIPPASSIRIVTGKGLQWTAQGARIAMATDFHFRQSFISGSGSITASVSGVNFDLGINIGEDTNGRPTLETRDCSAVVSSVSVEFHGKFAWLYNLLKGKVEDVIKSLLNQKMCEIITTEINTDANKQLAKLQVTTPLDKKFLLDYRLLEAPQFTNDYFETLHKGEIAWLASPQESPQVAPTMPDPKGASNMVYLELSDYVFNTAADVAQKHEFLRYNLTAKDLPASNRDVLNTSCGFIPKCVGALIPAIGKAYPNGKVELRMASTVAPKLSISSSGLMVQCAGNINMYANVPGRKDTPFLVTLSATLKTSVTVSIKNELVLAKIGDFSLNLKSEKSAVGHISDTFLDFITKEAINIVLIPKLNELGGKGFPLPVTENIHFVNTTLSLATDTIIVGTDLMYNATSRGDIHNNPKYDNDTQDPSDDTLRFRPYGQGQ